MIEQHETEMINRFISDLLNDIYDQYITDRSIIPLILSKDEGQVRDLKSIDALYRSVLTSLQFGQYRRAVWYLQAFALVCRKKLGDDSTKKVIHVLQKRIHF